MTKGTDGLKSVIAGWASLSSTWNDAKSKYIEDNIVNILEGAIVEMEDQLDDISMIAYKTAENIDEIERIGDSYGW